MSIGAINAYGSFNALSLRPYVYNTNSVSAASMSKLSRISDDVLDKKIDYSELTDESLNENPLKKGQTLNFQDMLDMQMRRGQNNAARIMRPMGTVQDTEEGTVAAQTVAGAGMDTAPARSDVKEVQAEKTVEAAGTDETVNAGSDNINYQMQQALRAYEMFMTA